MDSTALAEIESRIDRLSAKEQLLLIDRLARRLLLDDRRADQDREDRLVAMASDPQVRAETRRIEYEFAPTESDGLGGS